MRVGRSLWRVSAFLLMIGLAWMGATVLFGLMPDTGSVVFAQDEEAEGEADSDDDVSSEVEMESTPLPECPPGQVALDFTEDMDIRLVVKMIAKKLKKALLLDKAVTGTITIVAPNRCMSPDSAYDVFLSVLHLNGLTTVQVGEVIKIVKRADAQSQPIPTISGGVWSRSNERFITQLIPLENIDAVEISTAFRPLISPDGNIFAYGPSNMLIILDSAANVNRIMNILNKLDIEGTEEKIVVVPIEYASAENLAQVIMELFEDEVQGSRGSRTSSSSSAAAARVSRLRQRLQAARSRGGSRTPTRAPVASFSGSITSSGTLRIIPDTRTNSLVIKANRYLIKRIKDVIAKLDAPLPGGEGKIHVVYLENANSEDLASILADLAGTGGTSAGSRRMTTAQSRQTRTQAGGVAGAFGNRFGSGRLGSGGIQRGGAATGNPNRGIAQTTGRFLADFDGAVRITADPATNSLVIIASNRDFEILQEVIAKLDIPRPQVFVEVLIAEITVERGVDIGFEFRSTNDSTEEGIQVIGGTNYGGIQSAAVNPLGVTGFAIGAADGTLTFAGETFSNIGALFRAMQTDRDVNILATPHILTTDNEEAEIVIANNIPFITGQIFSANFNNPATTIERKDVGITLRITPQINESEMVRLTIYQESSTVTDSPEGLSASQVGITTAKRSADTVVIVKTRQTVVIGGLMQDNITYTEAKVPILGDIPILGYLFKSSRRKVEKTNLLIFITPYIIKDNGDLEEVTRRANYRLQHYREQNRLQQHFEIDENQMVPSNRVFRRSDPNAIEIDPSVRGTAVRPDLRGDEGEEETDAGDENEGETVVTEPDERSEDTDDTGDEAAPPPEDTADDDELEFVE